MTRLLTIIPSFFKTLVDHEVTVELKNDISIRGVLKSVDQFLNIKLDDIQVVEELKYPHLVSPAALQLCPRSKWGRDLPESGCLGKALTFCFYT